jgi:serine protease Do
VGLDERDGLLVRDVEEGSPAATAGIVEGDLIVEVAGKSITSIDDLFEALAAAPADKPLAVKVIRGIEERSVSVA